MVNLFLDTDFGPDCDDAGALQLTHYLCNRKEAKLLGVTHCTGNPWGLPAISALNRFNGREVPLGTSANKEFLAIHTIYNRPMAEQFPNEFTDGREQKDAVDVFKNVLAAQADGSVVVCSIGPLNNLADFLSDPECFRLMEKKVTRLVAMAGRFDGTGVPEWNVEMDVPAARKVVNEWPGEVIFCPFECGLKVVTGQGMKGYENDPAELAYRLHSGGMRSSWDPMTVLYAVQDEACGLMKRTAWGRIEMDERGVTTFREEEGRKHAYLMNVLPDEEISGALDRMICAR